MEDQSQQFRDLVAAVTRFYGTDPHLGVPHPATMVAIANAVALVCEVSKRRPKAYAHEKWLEQTTEEQLEHAVVHADTAQAAHVEGSPAWIDDDGLPHAAHAVLRLMFALYLHGDRIK
jgi:hypothetical protein